MQQAQAFVQQYFVHVYNSILVNTRKNINTYSAMFTVRVYRSDIHARILVYAYYVRVHVRHVHYCPNPISSTDGRSVSCRRSDRSPQTRGRRRVHVVCLGAPSVPAQTPRARSHNSREDGPVRVHTILMN